MNNTKKIVLCGLFVALSFIGANIKILGSIAFDSLPGFLGAIVLGPVFGGTIGFLGHMLTALTSGFPFSLPVHLIIAAFMFITMAAFSFTYRLLEKKRVNGILCGIAASIVGAVINGPVCLLALIPFLGVPTFYALCVPLTTVAAINAVMGFIVYEVLVRAKVVSKLNVLN